MRYLIAAVLLVAAPAFAESPKEKEIRKLLAITNASQLGGQVMHQVLATFKTQMPNVPPAFWAELSTELKPDDLMEKLIPVYDKHLSAQEVKDIIKFYESPSGKKLLAAQPAMVQESTVIGQEWGRDIAEKVLQKLKQKGLDKK
jgi:uncharacterized protein